MKTQKYQDMAYGNSRGLEWLNLLQSEQMWSRWVNKVDGMSGRGWIPDPQRAEKILTAAIWHFGYAHDSPNSEELRRTAKRLRKGEWEAPRDRGSGEAKGGFLSLAGPEMRAFGMPWEFWELDNFLEHQVRPMMASLTKVEG